MSSLTIGVLRKHMDGIGNVTVYLNVLKTTDFTLILDFCLIFTCHFFLPPELLGVHLSGIRSSTFLFIDPKNYGLGTNINHF